MISVWKTGESTKESAPFDVQKPYAKYIPHVWADVLAYSKLTDATEAKYQGSWWHLSTISLWISYGWFRTHYADLGGDFPMTPKVRGLVQVNPCLIGWGCGPYLLEWPMICTRIIASKTLNEVTLWQCYPSPSVTASSIQGQVRVVRGN